MFIITFARSSNIVPKSLKGILVMNCTDLTIYLHFDKTILQIEYCYEAMRKFNSNSKYQMLKLRR